MRLKYIQFILLLLGVARASPDPHHRDQTTEIITRVTTITVTARPNGAAQSSSAPAKPTSTIPVSALPEFTSASQFESIVLNSTNTYRVQHDAAPVRYNSSLAAFANEVTKSCRMEHSGGPFGENLAIGCTDLPGCIELWGDERDEYDFGRGKFTKTTGHFTQLVWKNTTDVGCAARFCARDGGKGGGGSWYLVCEYWPRGNVGGQFTDMVARKVKGKVTLRSVASGGKERVNKPVVVGFVFSLFGFVVMMM